MIRNPTCFVLLVTVAALGCGGNTEEVPKGICSECSKFVFSDLEGACNPYFNCVDTLYYRTGCWSEQFQCCWCSTCDCGRPCTKQTDCTGPCILCLNGKPTSGSLGPKFFCDTEPPYVGFCWHEELGCGGTGGCDLPGCHSYLDAAGEWYYLCTDPEEFF